MREERKGYMQNSRVAHGFLRQLRQRATRLMAQHPTDPPNIGLIIMGITVLIVAWLAQGPVVIIAAGFITALAGLVAILVARNKQYHHQALRITILGATIAFAANAFAFAPFPIWWMTLIPAGVGLTGGILYYWGIRYGLLWYLIEAALILVSVLVADASTPLPQTQMLIAGQLTLLILHLAMFLFLPEKTEAEARSTAVTQQSHELQNLAQQISATADGLGRASSAIHMVTGQQSSGAEQQASVITEAVTMLNEFIALADQVREQSRSITTLSEQTTEISTNGQNAIRLTSEGMSQIRSQVTVIAINIAGLAEQIRRIDEIIATVSEIAAQSNLLALNASIEAARAGVHGRGFAVVADEVRTLSQQSQNAAAQVQNILSEIQDAMKQTVRATQLGDQQVDEGMHLSEEAGTVITQLSDNVNESAAAMRNITIAIDQQTVGLEEITSSMRNIHDVTQKNLEATKTAEIVAENLNRLSEELLTAISGYAH